VEKSRYCVMGVLSPRGGGHCVIVFKRFFHSVEIVMVDLSREVY
jgi:hypothetical protein